MGTIWLHKKKGQTWEQKYKNYIKEKRKIAVNHSCVNLIFYKKENQNLFSKISWFSNRNKIKENQNWFSKL